MVATLLTIKSRNFQDTANNRQHGMACYGSQIFSQDPCPVDYYRTWPICIRKSGANTQQPCYLSTKDQGLTSFLFYIQSNLDSLINEPHHLLEISFLESSRGKRRCPCFGGEELKENWVRQHWSLGDKTMYEWIAWTKPQLTSKGAPTTTIDIRRQHMGGAIVQ